MNTKALVKQRANDLLSKKNVVGVAVGKKFVNGEDTGEEAIICLVQRKETPLALGFENLVPKKIEGVPTDVIEVGEIKAQETTDRFRPAPGGTSIGHPEVTAGTFGVLVKNGDGQSVILSNNHVMANSNDASIGDAIVQPGTLDGGNPANDTIATLQDFVEIDFGLSGGGGGWGMFDFIRQFLCRFFNIFCLDEGEPSINLVDAAIALPVNEEDVLPEVLNIGVPVGTTEFQIGMEVQKYGRTTDYTTGTVQAVGATVDVGYGNGRTARFEDQIITTAMSSGGDSGSAVFDMDGNLGGLLFAGSNTVTILNDIDNVFSELNLSL